MSSTEIVRTGQSNELVKPIVLPKSIVELPQYFYDKQRSDSPSFKNFEVPAEKLVDSLDRMAERSRVNEATSEFIPLNPERSYYNPSHERYLNIMEDKRPYQLFETDDSTESQALIDLTYHLTNAEEIYDTRRTVDGFVVMHGRHNESHVYFIEQYLRSEQGQYMVWSIASGIPEAVLRSEQSRLLATEARLFESIVQKGLAELDQIDLEQWRTAA